MKKLMFACLVLMLLGIPLAAQDTAQEEQQASGESTQSAPARPKFPVSILAGEMDLHTYLVSGFTAYSEEQEGNPYGLYGGKWNVGALNPEWWENRAEVTLEWKGPSMFGAVIDAAVQSWGLNNYQSSPGELRIPTAFGYLDTGKVKFSIGKIWEWSDGNMLGQKRLWGPDGSAGGDPAIISLDTDHSPPALSLNPSPA
jgi:hypothetical protein